MRESPLPKLTESREETERKIQARITKGQQLLNAPPTSIYEDLLNECEEWSRYNETLLVRSFGGNSENSNYRKFIGFRSGVDPIPPSELMRGMRNSINSLKGICERLDLYEEYSEPSNTTQHSFGNDVFIVHGHDDGAKETVASTVSDKLCFCVNIKSFEFLPCAI